jgi:hypothetical protein
MVSPRLRKQAVVVMRSEVAVSERRACGLIQIHRGTYRYRRRPEDGQLRVRHTGCMWRRSWAFAVSYEDVAGPPPQRDWCTGDATAGSVHRRSGQSLRRRGKDDQREHARLLRQVCAVIRRVDRNQSEGVTLRRWPRGPLAGEFAAGPWLPSFGRLTGNPAIIYVCGSGETIAKLGVGRMSTVTERFVLGPAAAAQGHAIASFVGVAIGADERDAPAHPQRTAALLRRILD